MAILTTTQAGLNFVGGTTYIQTGTTTLMAIATNGNIQFSQYGAGTLVTDASGNITVSSGGGVGGPYLPLSAGSSYPLTDNLFIRGDDKGLVVQDAASTTNVTVGAVSSSAVSTGLITLRHSGTTKILLNANDNSYFNNGNVGIGTTNPDSKLEVAGGTTGIILSNLGDSSAYDAVAMTYNGYNSGTPEFIFQPKTNPGSGIVNSYFRFKNRVSGGSNISNVTVDGKVGIGTDSPTEKLEVNGNIRLGNSASLLWGSNNLTLKTASSSTIGVFSLAPNSYGTVYAPRFQMLNASGVEGVSIRTDASSYFNGGNVGIGTTSPSEKLEVQGGNIKIDTTTNADAKLILNPYSSALGTAYQWELVGASSSQNYNFQIREAGQAYVTVDSSVSGNAGYVGIGTTSPSSKLQVAGGIQMADDTATASATKVGTMRYRTAINEPVPVTGTDLVINGDFSNGTTGWSFGAGWAVSNGGATVSTAGITSDIRQSISYVANISAATKFRYRFEITDITAGSLRLFVNKPTFTQIANVSAVGVYEYVVEVSTGSNGFFYLYSTSSSGNTFQGTVTNVSVLEVTEEDASYADMCMQTGASTYEWVNIVRNTY